MKKILNTLIIGLATIGLLVGAASTATAGTVHQWQEFPLVPTVNTCVSAGESLSGTVLTHFVVHSVVNKNGFTHFSVHVNIAGGTVTGDDTGNTYKVQSIHNQKQFNFVIPPPPDPIYPSDYPAINHLEDTLTVVGPGPMNNMKIHINWLVVFNANGEITVEMGAPPPEITCPDSH